MVEHVGLLRRPAGPPLPLREGEGTAIVELGRPDDDGGRRRLHVVLDGRPVAAVRPRGRAHLLITPGVHDLRVSSGWSDSPTVRVELADGDLLPVTVAYGLHTFATQWWRPWQALTLSVQPGRRQPVSSATRR